SLAFVMLSGYVKGRVTAARENVKSSSEMALQYLKEALSGYVEGNVYDKKVFLTDRYNQKQRTLNKYLASLQSVQVLPARLMETFAVFGLFGLISLNEFMGKHVFELTTIAAFLAAAYKIIPGSVKILNISSQIKTYAFAAEDIVSQNEIPQASAPQPIQSIEIKNISYRNILSNFSLCAKRGELVALTGISGKGKTTLLNSLLGFLEPGAGEILINGQSTSAAERKRFWSNTSYVKQQPFLIYENILTNITLNNEYSERPLQEAVEAAGLDLGLNTHITENGKNISGGQRQRIAFARALYKDADLFLLDEPFNELDDASEKKMLQHLQQLQAKGKIIILITHNRSSLSYCTKTVSMDA
ncbi:MAG TPA: ATP-binding cassette domain-containing protein, partial [Chitinophagaceae bacterium]|nr:ATP-binding cassette domain-containing protein [Chitinophagaceae bacterium]